MSLLTNRGENFFARNLKDYFWVKKTNLKLFYIAPLNLSQIFKLTNTHIYIKTGSLQHQAKRKFQTLK